MRNVGCTNGMNSVTMVNVILVLNAAGCIFTTLLHLQVSRESFAAIVVYRDGMMPKAMMVRFIRD